MQWDQIFTKINFMTFLWEDPCDAPWTVYVETALPAAMELFVVLVAPDLFEIQKNKYQRTLNPYRMRSSRKGNTGSKKRRSRWSRALGRLVSFDPNEAIGRRLNPTFKPPSRRIVSGRALLFIVGGVLERLVWYWFLISQIFEFLFNWSTALLKTEACSEPAAAVCLRNGEGQTIAPISPYQAVQFQYVIKQRGPITSNTFAITLAAGFKWIAITSVQFHVITPNVLVRVNVRIRNIVGDKNLTTLQLDDCVDNLPYTMELQTTGTGPLSLVVEIDTTGGGILTDFTEVYVMAKPLD